MIRRIVGANDERDFVALQRHFREVGMNEDALVAALLLRLEHQLQLVFDDAVAVGVGAGFDVGVELRVEVLDLVEKETAAAELVNIPTVPVKLIERMAEAREVHAGRGEVFGDFFLRQAARTGLGKRGDVNPFGRDEDKPPVSASRLSA